MYKIVYSEIKASNLDDALLFLPKEVKKHINNIRNYHRKKESICAWSLLNGLVKDTFCKELVEYPFRYNKNGKPEFDNFFVSLSHSKGIVCVAIADYEIGIDIEKIRNLNFQEKLKEKLGVNPQISNENFIALFTRKEAYVKAKGETIGRLKNLDRNIEKVANVIIQIEDDMYSLAYYPNASEVEIIKK